MKIEVRLFGFLLKFAPGQREVFESVLEEGSTVRDLVVSLRIPASEARQSLVNGTHAADDRVLRDGDKVVLLTPVEGG